MTHLKQPIQPTRILIVEDNPMDVKFLQHVFEYEPGWNTEFVTVEDGEEAIEYLLHPDTPKPDLVILDLNMPKKNGIDVLKVIRTTHRFYGLRVAIFSSSPEDVIRSRLGEANLQADDYINKPFGFGECSSLVKRFHHCCDPGSRLSQFSVGG
jgi:chemotaxis family two-component system response regulator Rcp1